LKNKNVFKKMILCVLCFPGLLKARGWWKEVGEGVIRAIKINYRYD
jgi:hypothetical protein